MCDLYNGRLQGCESERAIPELFLRKPPEGDKEACGTGFWGLD